MKGGSCQLSSSTAPLLVDKIKSYSTTVSLKGLPGTSVPSNLQKRRLIITHGHTPLPCALRAEAAPSSSFSFF